ncbi:MAG: sugar transferase, partial [Alphaproteobacteria bacterium]|nr:sugar transferase [Alphaproteobacteria bacterium]
MNMEVRDVALRAPGFNVGEVFSPAYNRLKRGFDIALCIAILPLLLPFMALIAVLVKLDGGPVFYTQSRVGRAGRMFGCLKFRTMVPNAERKLEQILKNDPAGSHEHDLAADA